MIATDQIAYIRERLPELDLLDADIGDRVARVWARMWAESSWENLDEAVAYKGLAAPTLLQHVRMTVRGSLALADCFEEVYGLTLDRQKLIVCGLLLDVSKLVELDLGPDGATKPSERGVYLGHPFYAAHVALTEGFSEEVAHVILAHSTHLDMNPETPEGRLLRRVDYADREVVVGDSLT
jgi:hypothetical protein